MGHDSEFDQYLLAVVGGRSGHHREAFMKASAIRELASSKNSTLIAAGFFKETVQIWDLKLEESVGEFPTVFCTGAKNLALAPLGGPLVVGSSKDRGNVAAYEVPSGRVLWEQRLPYPSSLRFDASGRSVFCTRKQSSVLRLDIDTGSILDVFEQTRQFFEGPSGDALSVPVEQGKDPIRLIRMDHTSNIERPGIAVLDAQFSPHSVCFSEAGRYLSGAGGPVRCISRVDGSLQWMFEPGADNHVVRLHYSPNVDAFFGILVNFGKACCRSLVRFDAIYGTVDELCELGSWEEAFVDAADQLVTSSGETRDLSNGAVVGRLVFPLKEYPDE